MAKDWKQVARVQKQVIAHLRRQLREAVLDADAAEKRAANFLRGWEKTNSTLEKMRDLLERAHEIVK